MAKKKTAQAHDGLITPEHLREAQQSTMHFGTPKTLKAIQIIEPELAGFISVVASHIAAHAMFDGEMPRPAAQQLRESIVALALNVFQAQHLAVYSYYKDIIRDTPAAALDAEAFPKLPPEEGDACVPQ